MYFPSTHWSRLANAVLSNGTEDRDALGELCRRYWSPLKTFIHRRGYSEAEAEDLTQEFLLHLLERNALMRADPLRGKFRSFLLGALLNFLSHERERRLSQKRGGQHIHLSVEVMEEKAGLHAPGFQNGEVGAFDRAWALTVMAAVLAQVERHYLEAGKGELYATLRPFLPGGTAPPSYQEVAARAGITVAALNSEIHRLRRLFRETLYREVAATVSTPQEIEEELCYLYQVLLDRGTDDLIGAKENSRKP